MPWHVHFFSGEVIKLNTIMVSAFMRNTGQHHNTAMIRQLINQACNQNEVSNMIGQKLKFQVEFLLQFRQCHDSGIGDNAIEPEIT